MPGETFEGSSRANRKYLIASGKDFPGCERFKGQKKSMTTANKTDDSSVIVDSNNDVIVEIPEYHLNGHGDDFDDDGNPTLAATYRKAMKADLKAIILGKEVYDFYGAHSHYFCLGQNNNKLVFEALEDPSDGYRSYYHSTIVAKDPGGFFATPIAQVKLTMRKYQNDPFYILKDAKDKHVWLRFGTANTHDYYPYFIFQYFPKEGAPALAT